MKGSEDVVTDVVLFPRENENANAIFTELEVNPAQVQDAVGEAKGVQK